MSTQQTASLLSMLKPMAVGQPGAVGARSVLDGEAGSTTFSSLMALQFDATGAALDAPVASDVQDLSLIPATDVEVPAASQEDALKAKDANDVVMPWDMPIPWVPPQQAQPLVEQVTAKSANEVGDMPAAVMPSALASGAALSPLDPDSALVQAEPTPTPLTEKFTLQAPMPSAEAAVNVDSNVSLQDAGLMQAEWNAGKPLARMSGPQKSDPEVSKTTVSVSMGRAAGIALTDQPTSMTKTFDKDKGLLSLDPASASVSKLAPLLAKEDVSSGAKELMFSQFLTHAAGASAQMPGQSAGASSVAAFHAVEQLSHPVGSSQFVDELVGRVGMFVRGPAQNGPMTAELHLNPTDMGPVQVRIELDGAQAQVHFMAHQADTRQAIEASLASLGDNLRDAGLQLTQANVSDSFNGGANNGANSGFAQNGSGHSGNGAMADGQSRGSFGQQNADGQNARRLHAEPPTAPAQPNRNSRGNSVLDMYA